MNNKFGIHYGYWAKRWDQDLKELIIKASNLGFDILEVNPPSFMLELSKEKIKDLKKVAEEYEIELTYCIGYPAHMDMASPDKEIRKAGQEYTKRVMEAIHYSGANILSGILYSYWPALYTEPITDKKPYIERSLQSLNEVVKVAEDYDILLALEVVNRFEQFMINTTEEGLDFINQIDSPNIKLLLDLFHMNIEEDNISNALELAGNQLGHLHICENNRKVPKKDNAHFWTNIADTLKHIDYNGRIVFEPFVKTGGPVGNDLRIWRDLSNNADEEQMNLTLKESLQYIKALINDR